MIFSGKCLIWTWKPSSMRIYFFAFIIWFFKLKHPWYTSRDIGFFYSLRCWWWWNTLMMSQICLVASSILEASCIQTIGTYSIEWFPNVSLFSVKGPLEQPLPLSHCHLGWAHSLPCGGWYLYWHQDLSTWRALQQCLLSISQWFSNVIGTPEYNLSEISTPSLCLFRTMDHKALEWHFLILNWIQWRKRLNFGLLLSYNDKK